jgi:hypothetical protein
MKRLLLFAALLVTGCNGEPGERVQRQPRRNVKVMVDIRGRHVYVDLDAEANKQP